MSELKICAVIPVYKHGETVGAVVRALSLMDIPSILVDDGNVGASKEALVAVNQDFPTSTLVSYPVNGGKGFAVCAGLKKAIELGYTHALQIDADGQHDLSNVSFFCKAAKKHPEGLIAGLPTYDGSVPKSRERGRLITNFWVMVETLSCTIPDAMCGFRMYPLENIRSVLNKGFFDYRMGFDIEVLVRLNWAGIKMYFYPVKVIYPEGGISNFRMLQDNLAISKTHTFLFFGMLIRLPRLLLRHFSKR